MLINVSETHEAQGLRKICDFKIASNGIMIRALTQRLYSNPIASVVRELACNALDACPSVPMAITLPSEFNPAFTIRDHGPGLSEDQMVSIFTTFGESTKRHTNEQIGGFGLGAKSPFALGNSFTVISRHAGTRTTYIASIGEDGMPGLHVVSVVPTRESGLEIQVPANPRDLPKWTEALDQIRLFNPAPLVGGTPLEHPTYAFDNGLIAIPNPDQLLTSRPTVLVGPVAYPLDHPEIRGSLPAILRFPIGAIEVTASREAIVYSPEVVRHLSGRYQQATRVFEVLAENLLRVATIPLVQKIIQWHPTLYEWKWKDSFLITPSYIKPLHEARWQRYYSLPPSPRKINWEKSVLCYPEDTYVYLDTTDNWQVRLLAQNPQGRVVITDSPSVLELGFPVIKISSLPIPGSAPTTPKPVRSRVYTMEEGKLVPYSGSLAGHYVRIRSQKNLHLVIKDRVTLHPLTQRRFDAMQDRLGHPVLLATNSIKGMTDVTARYVSLIDDWFRTNYEGWASYREHRAITAVSPSIKAFVQFLHAQYLLPPAPPVPPGMGPDISLVYSYPADCLHRSPFYWEPLLTGLKIQHPDLFWAASKLDCADPRTLEILSRLI